MDSNAIKVCKDCLRMALMSGLDITLFNKTFTIVDVFQCCRPSTLPEPTESDEFSMYHHEINIFEGTCENPDNCDNAECAEHGYICGACGSFIIEEAEIGDGEAYYHARNESCYASKLLIL